MEYLNYMLVLYAYSEDLKQYLALLVITLSNFPWILLLSFIHALKTVFLFRGANR